MSRPWRRPADVGEVVDAGTVYLAHLPAGPIALLEGSASVIWELAVTSPRDELVAHVAEAFDVDTDAVRADVEAFVADLLARGLLED